MYTAQNALSTTLLSSAPRSTGSDVFPQPAAPAKGHKGLIIGLGCGVGVLFIGIIIVVVMLIQQKKKAQEREVIYGANASGDRQSSETPLI